MMLASKENNKALSNLNDNLLEKLIDRVIIESYFLSPLSKITHLQHTSQFKLVKFPEGEQGERFVNKQNNTCYSVQKIVNIS